MAVAPNLTESSPYWMKHGSLAFAQKELIWVTSSAIQKECVGRVRRMSGAPIRFVFNPGFGRGGVIPLRFPDGMGGRQIKSNPLARVAESRWRQQQRSSISASVGRINLEFQRINGRRHSATSLTRNRVPVRCCGDNERGKTGGNQNGRRGGRAESEEFGR